MNKTQNLLTYIPLAVSLLFSASASGQTANANKTTDANVSINELLQNEEVSQKDRQYIKQEFVKGNELKDKFKAYAVGIKLPENFLDTILPNNKISTNVLYTSQTSGSISLEQVLKGLDDRGSQSIFRLAQRVLDGEVNDLDLCDATKSLSNQDEVEVPENIKYLSLPVFMDPENNTHDSPLKSIDEAFFKTTLVGKNSATTDIPGFLTLEITYDSINLEIKKVNYTVHKIKGAFNENTYEEISNPLTNSYKLDRLDNLINFIVKNGGVIDQEIPCPFNETATKQVAVKDSVQQKDKKIYVNLGLIGSKTFDLNTKQNYFSALALIQLTNKKGYGAGVHFGKTFSPDYGAAELVRDMGEPKEYPNGIKVYDVKRSLNTHSEKSFFDYGFSLTFPHNFEVYFTAHSAKVFDESNSWVDEEVYQTLPNGETVFLQNGLQEQNHALKTTETIDAFESGSITLQKGFTVGKQKNDVITINAGLDNLFRARGLKNSYDPIFGVGYYHKF